MLVSRRRNDVKCKYCKEEIKRVAPGQFKAKNGFTCAYNPNKLHVPG
jgi:hypothetical protein